MAEEQNCENPALSRLCASCGMCCNGVLFQAVNLQSEDPVKDLKALGFRFKTKRDKTFFSQPCTAFKGSCCAVYEHRPQRCRLFNCKQLVQVASGALSEAEALEMIQEAGRRAARVKELLLRAGSTNTKRPLATRYELIMAQPKESLASGDLQTREELIKAMEELEEILSKEFRM